MVARALRRGEGRVLQSRLMKFMNRVPARLGAGSAVATIAGVSSQPFPDQPPLRTWREPVGGGHVLHCETWGLADGLPALVLHGGPGSGMSPLLRRFLDPGRFHVVTFDQRGAGRSLPAGGLVANTTDDLLADIRALRRRLGIARWLVVGGSWGATLALLHALDEPEAVAGVLMRGSFLARAEDVATFFASAPAALREGWRTLPDLDDDQADALAAQWWGHEQAMAGAASPVPPVAAPRQRYRVQAHYLRQGCFLGTRPLVERAAALPASVPVLLLHGALDRVCPTAGARLLAAAMPHAWLREVEGAGHDPSHPAMVAAMCSALDGFVADAGFTQVAEAAA